MLTILQLALKSLLNRKGAAVLTCLCIGSSVMLLLGVERLRVEAKDSFSNSVSGTDLIVGARGSPAQILLYSVFNIGYPSKNIEYATYVDLCEQSGVRWAIPLSMGDNHRGYRVIGTDGTFFEHYQYGAQRSLQFNGGLPFSADNEAVIGAEVARKLGYNLGKSIVVAHGAGDVSFIEHDAHPFTVIGILAPTGTPVDQQILVSLAGIEAMHADFNDGSTASEELDPLASALAAVEHAADCPHDHHDHSSCAHQPSSLSAILVGLENRSSVLAQQRRINESGAEPLTAVIPGVALQELWSLLRVVENTLRIISLFVILIGLFGMLTTLLSSLNERRREMSILRSVGAHPSTLCILLVGEAALLSIASCLLGLGLLFVGLLISQPILQSHFGILLPVKAPSSYEWGLLLLVCSCGSLSGLIPGWRMQRMALADGLTPKL
ncbi:ABC transporter permease [Coraliomargarita akajimensis]|uniref:ABC3 transporter permease protein domain-containing protein n=1 Tax=Coraliomargarita akajimensis (strain DSM 45221 / IAM 15411 / JCM 23193 / KCTC 12865 / 04OKA010-24) TaxID=583355 RepID=D5EPR5_CORAD|nr:ABC transporter permease [Coraliomargarita akajimensis]ADE55648.1 protein of unknown function DUF214 [Coraliomargarita akajimensis DSM 45221]